LLDQDLGAGIDAVDTDLLVRYPTIAKQAIAAKKRAETISEELRVLYVAMTRPKDMLIMTYCSKYLRTELSGAAQSAQYPANPATAAAVANPGQWVLAAAYCRPEANDLFYAATRPPCVGYRDEYPWVIQVHWTDDDAVPDAPQYVQPSAQRPDAAIEWDETAFAYSYPHHLSTQIPAKLTATQMKGRALDAEAAELAPVTRTYTFELPHGGLNAAERGSATHLAMQYLDFKHCAEVGVSAELERLRTEGYLTEEQADSVRGAEIERLLHAPLGERIRSHLLAREMKFSILLPADRCIVGAPHEERLMVQGVADCILREESGLTVIDYKTDRIAPNGGAARAERYLAQMRTYCMAVEELYGERPTSCLLYFFATGETIEVIDQI
jgi:ATP-dependent helicase/nuclease subunit A